MLQITNPLAKGSNKTTLSSGRQVAAVFSCPEKRNTRSSSIGVWSMRLAGDESPRCSNTRAFLQGWINYQYPKRLTGVCWPPSSKQLDK